MTSNALTEEEIHHIDHAMTPLLHKIETLEKSNAKKDVEIIVLRHAYENVMKQVDEIVKNIKTQSKGYLSSSSFRQIL